jgi:hypothetical protein
MTTIENLTRFREKFPLTRVTVFDDCLVYKVKRGYAKLSSDMANEIIEKESLPLVSIPTTLSAGDSFTVQNNEIGYI